VGRAQRLHRINPVDLFRSGARPRQAGRHPRRVASLRPEVSPPLAANQVQSVPVLSRTQAAPLRPMVSLRLEQLRRQGERGHQEAVQQQAEVSHPAELNPPVAAQLAVPDQRVAPAASLPAAEAQPVAVWQPAVCPLRVARNKWEEPEPEALA
jgi:hypothetical protein